MTNPIGVNGAGKMAPWDKRSQPNLAANLGGRERRERDEKHAAFLAASRLMNRAEMSCDRT
jgi:hypothetical protein